MRKHLLVAAAAMLLAGAAAGTAQASHSWGNYHWARTSNPFTLQVVDSNTSNWDDNLGMALKDWSTSTVLDAGVTSADDSSRTRKQCRQVAGKIRSCNATYGFNGWLGLASINISGVHITSGTSKMNDSYLASSSYNETARQHVMCQEIGHDFGLGHQDESGADLNTCMDYADALDNPSPNAHDYQQLQTIYDSHTDSSSTIAAAASSAAERGEQPTKTEREDRIASSTVTEHFADGSKRVTHIFWAIGEERGSHKHDD